MTTLADALGIEDSTALKLPAGLYTTEDLIAGKPPFGVLYSDQRGFKLRVGGAESSIKSRLIVEPK